MNREETLANMQRAHELAHAANEVTKFEHTLARMFAQEHPNDPIVHGLENAQANLDALTNGDAPQRFSLIQGGAS